jgi:hypothetical protein
MSDWEWVDDTNGGDPECKETWSVRMGGDVDYSLPSVVIPTGKKLWRIVPPDMGWDEYTKELFRTKERAMVAARMLFAAGVWR